MQVVDAAISESVFNMLEGCVPEYTEQGYNRPPSGSTISGAPAKHAMHPIWLNDPHTVMMRSREVSMWSVTS